MRNVVAAVFLSAVIVFTAKAAIPSAPANFHNDDVITLLYDPAHGYFSVDNPAGDDAAADAISTFELTSSEDFFIGPAPSELDGLFDVWSPTKAFRLAPTGFFDMDWPAGTVATGMINVHDILTLNGSFLSGGDLAPVDLCVCTIPEPNGVVLLAAGAICLTFVWRRRC